MLFTPRRSPLSFEDAMSIHVFRAGRSSYSELIRRFGDHQSHIAAILAGRLHPGSWEKAMERFTAGDYWHPAIAAMVDQVGYLQLLARLTAAHPKPRPRRFNLDWCRQSLRLPSPATSR
jgi:hypothetical protein